jgi:oligopeptide transport system ATP-binding protein
MMDGPDTETDGPPLLEVAGLHVEFRSRDAVAKVINGVSLRLAAGETLAVLGESGSGKSVTAQAIMGILDSPPARVTGGRIAFRGADLLAMKAKQRRLLRGESIAMVFQDALSALNSVFTVGFQIAEQFRVRRKLGRAESTRRAIEMLDLVGIPNAAARVHDYPHQFSGGMRQRVMIAMSLALDPEVLIADEPTTALDVTVQAQIMELLRSIQAQRRMGVILITHDLGVVADVADRVAVMYAGRIVEQARVGDIYHRPAHPYTEGLLRSMPSPEHKGKELFAITGTPPDLRRPPAGCPFHPRCPRAEAICSTALPEPVDLGEGRRSACHFAAEVLAGG